MAIPLELLACLRQTSFDPMATRKYNIFDGGFRWSDEFPPEFFHEVIRLDYWLDRYLAAHRAALILGEDVHRFRTIWMEVEREVPNWPGLRAERCDFRLGPELVAKRRDSDANWDEVEERWRKLN